MKTLAYLYHNFRKPVYLLLVLCLTVAFARVIILKSTNLGLQNLILGELPPIKGLIMVILGVITLVIIQPIFYKRSIVLIEDFILAYRLRIGQYVKKVSLQSFEQIAHYQFLDVLGHQSHFLAERVFTLVLFTQSVCEWIFIMVYASVYISSVVGVVVIVIVVCLLVVAQFINEKVKSLKSEITLVNEKYARSIEDLVLGFKELKVNYKKQKDLQINQEKYLNDLNDLNIKLLGVTDHVQYYALVLVYACLGFFLFLFTILSNWSVVDTLQIAIAFLFIAMPFQRIIGHWVYLSMIDDSLDSMLWLEEALTKNIEKTSGVAKKEAAITFKHQLTLSGVTFAYTNTDGKMGYKLGPTDLDLHKGEVLFIVGGNGSGKSTMLKVLTSLYPKESGKIFVDGRVITEENIEQYRELFAAIFTDFYLPNHLLGVKKVNVKKVNQLLQLFGLKGKTAFKENRFTTMQLSTGQRKRLAMVTSFLENKEIYIFDEVAADQDPDHRKLFYEFILPDMKKAGKTCIVVSHDDHYFHTADRILEMKNGKLTPHMPIH